MEPPAARLPGALHCPAHRGRGDGGPRGGGQAHPRPEPQHQLHRGLRARELRTREV